MNTISNNCVSVYTIVLAWLEDSDIIMLPVNTIIIMNTLHTSTRICIHDWNYNNKDIINKILRFFSYFRYIKLAKIYTALISSLIIIFEYTSLHVWPNYDHISAIISRYRFPDISSCPTWGLQNNKFPNRWIAHNEQALSLVCFTLLHFSKNCST